MRPMTARASSSWRKSSGTSPYSSSGSSAGSSTGASSHGDGGGGSRLRTISRAIASACSSDIAKWSATPDRRVWTSAPPSSSAVTSWPVAAFTSGGPPMKIVPVPFTITVSSDMAGT